MLQGIARFIERHQQWFGWPLIMAMSLLAFATAFLRPAFLEQIELKTLDQRFMLRGEIRPDPRVVIVAVDDEALTRVGRWPWPRERVGRLVERLLDEYGAAALGMDIVFSESQRNPVDESLRLLPDMPPRTAAWLREHGPLVDPDAGFGRLLKRYRDRLVLGYFFYPEGADVPAAARADLSREAALLRPSAMAVEMSGEMSGEKVAGVPHMAAVEGNLPAFSRAAELAGFFTFFPDVDGMVRRVALLAELDGMIYPNLDLQMLRLALGWPELSARIGPAGVEQLCLGEHRIPVDRSGGMLLNHYGPERTFVHVSAADVLAGRVPSGVLKDAIVLLGVTAAGVYDYRPSPFDSTFPGVEGHAAALSNILHDEAIRRPQVMEVAELFAVLLFSLLCGRLVLRSGPVMQGISLIGVPLLLLSVAFWLFVAYGWWLKVTYLLFGALLAAAPVTLCEYIIESRRRLFIHEAFSHYLAPGVVEELTRHPEQLRLGGEKRHMTAFFSDIAGFSSFSEQLEPEELVRFLNLYLSAMSDIIIAHGGTIDKFEGDAIIAFFGAPVEMPDHALRCVRAGLEQQAVLADLRRQWSARGYPEIHIRIGINSGPMVVGNMGTTARMNYTMMGDHVNLAARLEGVNKVYHTPVLISGDTYDLVRDEVAARFVDRVRVVGRSKAVDIYQPLGPRGSVDVALLERSRTYEQAWRMMFRRHFDEAEAMLVRLCDAAADGPAEALLARVRAYRKRPPERNWDGVFELHDK